jgi:hypothetical protein
MKKSIGISFLGLPLGLPLGFIFGLVLMTACKQGSDSNQGEDKRESMYQSIKVMEDSIQKMTASNIPVNNVHNLELINRLVDFQKEFPTDEKAAECLDKVHLVYSKMNLYDKAAGIVDTILENYPKYANRSMLLESQAGSYDIFITPRDTTKVKYYYNLLLKEDSKMDAEKKAGILERLKYVGLTFDEYIERINQ